jgi:hypothetical protein
MVLSLSLACENVWLTLSSDVADSRVVQELLLVSCILGLLHIHSHNHVHCCCCIGEQLVASQGLEGLAAAVGARPSAVLLDRYASKHTTLLCKLVLCTHCWY